MYRFADSIISVGWSYPTDSRTELLHGDALANAVKWRRATYKLLKMVAPQLLLGLTLNNDSWRRVRNLTPNGQQELGERWLHRTEPQEHVVDRLIYGYSQLVNIREVPIKDKLRTIWVPQPLLTEVLQAIRIRILAGCPVHQALHGYVRRRSIITCATVHQQDRYLLSFDLADAFETNLAQFGLCHLFETWRFRISGLREILRALIAPNQCFPQGFCTSPQLFNLAMTDMVSELDGWCRHFGWTLSVYSDNLFLSRDDLADYDVNKTIRTVKRLIEAFDWEVNDRKTTFTDRDRVGSLRLLGLVIKNGQICLSHERLRELRRQLWLVVDELRGGPSAEEVELLRERYLGLMQLPNQLYGTCDPPAILHPPLAALAELL